LLTTGLELDPCEAVSAYDGRDQIEMNMDEVKELGLGHDQYRREDTAGQARRRLIERRRPRLSRAAGGRSQ
jgi:hypothetical protein